MSTSENESLDELSFARLVGERLRQIRQQKKLSLSEVESATNQEFKMLERLLRMIQVQRQDFNGKVITVRAHDTRAIAVMLDVAVDDVGAKLAELDLLFVPPTA